jgi:hypothetical protein
MHLTGTKPTTTIKSHKLKVRAGKIYSKKTEVPKPT